MGVTGVLQRRRRGIDRIRSGGLPRLRGRDEILIALNLYCNLPFGSLHSRNPQIIRYAGLLHRSPDALAMKLTNIASLDPTHQARGVKGLPNSSHLDREIWIEFFHDPTRIALESETQMQLLQLPAGPSEDLRLQKTRRVQSFFRRTVLNSYHRRCGLCGIRSLALLCASHIIPWCDDATRRADPTNGISLCALHDRAFDRGLLTFDETLRAVVSDRLTRESETPVGRLALLDVHGKALELPYRFGPDPNAMAHHREHIFR
ncbi:MAG: HNH endonuclease [Candidatus Xenobia bacterium]